MKEKAGREIGLRGAEGVQWREPQQLVIQRGEEERRRRRGKGGDEDLNEGHEDEVTLLVLLGKHLQYSSPFRFGEGL